MTVFEKFKSESAEEFAKRLASYEDKSIQCVFCIYASNYCYKNYCYKKCIKGIISYLNSEVITN